MKEKDRNYLKYLINSAIEKVDSDDNPVVMSDLNIALNIINEREDTR